MTQKQFLHETAGRCFIFDTKAHAGQIFLDTISWLYQQGYEIVRDETPASNSKERIQSLVGELKSGWWIEK